MINSIIYEKFRGVIKILVRSDCVIVFHFFGGCVCLRKLALALRLSVSGITLLAFFCTNNTSNARNSCLSKCFFNNATQEQHLQRISMRCKCYSRRCSRKRVKIIFLYSTNITPMRARLETLHLSSIGNIMISNF